MLKISEISFPGFGIDSFHVNSVAFKIGELEIAWYAIIITIGIIAAVIYTIYRAGAVGISVDDIIDIALFTVPSGVIGARLYYVFSKLEDFHSLKEVLNIRSGGLAIYGGILAGALAVLITTKVKKIPFLVIADCCTPGIILAQAIGRWGNFMNGEAYGYETTIFCRMGLNGMYVHPTFLYESLWNILGVILINLFYKKRQYDGQVFLSVFAWYGLGRFFIEGLRTDSLYMTIFGLNFRTSQLLAAVIFLICTSFLVYFIYKKPNKQLYIKKAPEKKVGK